MHSSISEESLKYFIGDHATAEQVEALDFAFEACERIRPQFAATLEPRKITELEAKAKRLKNELIETLDELQIDWELSMNLENAKLERSERYTEKINTYVKVQINILEDMNIFKKTFLRKDVEPALKRHMKYIDNPTNY